MMMYIIFFIIKYQYYYKEKSNSKSKNNSQIIEADEDADDSEFSDESKIIRLSETESPFISDSEQKNFPLGSKQKSKFCIKRSPLIEEPEQNVLCGSGSGLNIIVQNSPRSKKSRNSSCNKSIYSAPSLKSKGKLKLKF